MSAASGPAERLTPSPRVSSAVTNADPVLTRFALGRSNDGSQFGMFLQIFADGTVVDSEGVHHVRPADLKPIVDAVQSGELYRLRGHCGAPSTDFIEYVHIVAYERRLGRLRPIRSRIRETRRDATMSIRHLHTALENLQAQAQPSAGGAGRDGRRRSTPPAGVGDRRRPFRSDRSRADEPGSGAVPRSRPTAGNCRRPPPAGAVIPLTPADAGR